MPLAEIFAGIKDGITSLSDEEKTEIRSKVSEILRQAKPHACDISKLSLRT